MKFLILIFLGFLLGGCSVDSSDEELLFPEDLHKSEHDLAITAEADARRQEDRIAPTDRLLFQIENKILKRDNQPFSLTRTKKEISDELDKIGAKYKVLSKEKIIKRTAQEISKGEKLKARLSSGSVDVVVKKVNE